MTKGPVHFQVNSSIQSIGPRKPENPRTPPSIKALNPTLRDVLISHLKKAGGGRGGGGGKDRLLCALGPRAEGSKAEAGEFRVAS